VASASDGVFLESGKRLLVKTEGRDDYKPKIVNCDTSSIGICIRDTRSNPANNPIEKDNTGNLTVKFPSWGIGYIIKKDGTGDTLDKNGKKLTPFKWKLI
jgi:hypothetical protein